MKTRSDSELELKYFKKPLKKSKSLIYGEWSDAMSVNHLNIIDSKQKKILPEFIPWINIPVNEQDVQNFCQANIYGVFRRYFMNSICKSENNQIPSWLQKLLSVCEIYDVCSDGDEASRLYCDIICCLFDKGCLNPLLLLEIWHRVCGKSDRSRIAVLESLVGRHRIRRSTKVLKYVLRSAREVKFDFWGAWGTGRKVERFPFCPVTSAFLNGSVDQITILLQYGFQQNSQRIHTYDKFFLCPINYGYLWLKKALLGRTLNRKSLLTEIMLFLVQVACSHSYAIRVAHLKCFHLLWDTMTEPFVTPTELRSEVRRRFRNPPEEHHRNFFPHSQSEYLKMCDFYEEVVLEGKWKISEPRSLQHLCKCSLRTALQKAWNLPDGIKSLPLPYQLQTYLYVS